MKKFFMLATICGVFVTACSRDNDSTDNPGIPVGEVTPVGQPDGTAAVNKVIGQNGGTIVSSDGKLTVVIPQGAVDGDKNFSIQIISGTNPIGGEKAYRLQPHGQAFAKPVTVRFSYTDQDVENTAAEAFGIAYQDEKGIWQAKGGPVLDKTGKTVSVTTTHFSDWSFFASFSFDATVTSLPTGASAELEVWSAADLTIPLNANEQTPIGKKKIVPASYLKKWTLTGDGNLTVGQAKATYKAPGVVPQTPNPVAITVEVDSKNRGLFLIVKHIGIFSDMGEIEVSIGGGPWIKQAANATKLGDNYFSVADMDGDDAGQYVFVTWQGGIGTTAFKKPTENTGTHAHVHVTNGNEYNPYFINDQTNQLEKSGGGVTITSMGETDGFIKGTFSIQPAGYGDDMRSKINIEGRFKVKKNWN